MEFGGEVRLLIEDGEGLASSSACTSTSASICLCRICHEEEEESSTTMESSCACSGTVKYAHRECIQRWCDEKGSIICEICLQKFEPGYTVPEKKTLVDVGVTIRGSLEVPRVNYDPLNPEYITSVNGASDYDEAECAPSSHRSATCCRSVALVFTILLLMRHLIAVVSVGADEYAFTILTLYLLRASGILLPFYLVTRFIKSTQHSQRQNQPQQHHEENNSSTIDVQGNEIELRAVEVC